MKFPRRAAAPVEETAADFYDRTRQLLLDATKERDEPKLRRIVIRMEGDRFSALSTARQSELAYLYKYAAKACGMGAP